MVKWLKIDKQDKTRRRRQEIASPFIIFEAGNYYCDEKCKPLSHYILLQSWQDRNKKP